LEVSAEYSLVLWEDGKFENKAIKWKDHAKNTIVSQNPILITQPPK